MHKKKKISDDERFSNVNFTSRSNCSLKCAFNQQKAACFGLGQKGLLSSDACTWIFVPCNVIQIMSLKYYVFTVCVPSDLFNCAYFVHTSHMHIDLVLHLSVFPQGGNTGQRFFSTKFKRWSNNIAKTAATTTDGCIEKRVMRGPQL